MFSRLSYAVPLQVLSPLFLSLDQQRTEVKSGERGAALPFLDARAVVHVTDQLKRVWRLHMSQQDDIILSKL